VSKLPFDRGYFEGASDDYLSGIRPEDPPRIGVFGIACVFGLFIVIGYVAAHVF
jgi:hypothetical protein